MSIATLGAPAGRPRSRWPTRIRAGHDRAAAPAPPLVALHLDRCPGGPGGRRAEHDRRRAASARSLPAAGDGLAIGATVRVVCEGLRAEIEIDDPMTGKTIGRVVDLAAAAPVARPHLLALSIVELLAASWIELQSNPHPPAHPVGSDRDARSSRGGAGRRQQPAGPRRGPRLLAAVWPPRLRPPDRALLGGGSLVAGDVGRPLRLDGRRGVPARRAATSALGRVTADSASTLGALARARLDAGRAAVRAGLGVRGGGAWLSGTPADPPPPSAARSAALGGDRSRWSTVR